MVVDNSSAWRMDPEVPLAGVVLNNVATTRQERVIRDALEGAGAPPVLGAVPRVSEDPLPGRHLGLVTATEHPGTREAIDTAARLVEAHVDLDALLAIAETATPVELPERTRPAKGAPVRIGVLRDEAFSFYYPENLESLENAGARLVAVSPSGATALPEVDGLYIGGGFPETHASLLSANESFRRSVFQAAQRGLPIWADPDETLTMAPPLPP